MADMRMEAIDHISTYFFQHGTTDLVTLYSNSEAAMLADVRKIASS